MTPLPFPPSTRLLEYRSTLTPVSTPLATLTPFVGSVRQVLATQRKAWDASRGIPLYELITYKGHPVTEGDLLTASHALRSASRKRSRRGKR